MSRAMQATVRLMQVDGVKGPVGRIDGETRPELETAAKAWAAGQTGHPWDVLAVEPDDDDAFEVEQVEHG